MRWNPEQRLEKTLNNLDRQIIELRDLGVELCFTIPYLRLLTLASIRARPNDKYVRFLITKHRGFESNERFIGFVSQDHRI